MPSVTDRYLREADGWNDVKPDLNSKLALALAKH